MTQIEQWRTDRGLSREDVARDAGVSYEAVRRVERGDVRPRMSTARGIARALGRTTREVLAASVAGKRSNRVPASVDGGPHEAR